MPETKKAAEKLPQSDRPHPYPESIVSDEFQQVKGFWMCQFPVCTALIRQNPCGEGNPSFGPVPLIVQNAILRVMWPFRKKTKQPKVVFNREHIWRELMAIPKRPLSEEEMEWVRQSLSSRKEFVEFRPPQLFAVSKCPCGTCRTVGLEPVELPSWSGESGHLGGITIETKNHGPIDILLHADKGFLVEMEVIWYHFPKPFPKSWVEVRRIVDPLH